MQGRYLLAVLQQPDILRRESRRINHEAPDEIRRGVETGRRTHPKVRLVFIGQGQQVHSVHGFHRQPALP